MTCAAFLAGVLLPLATGCAGDGTVGASEDSGANADRPEGVRLSVRFPDDTEVRIRGVDEMHNTLPVDGTTLPWVSYEVVEITKLISQARKHGDADLVEVSVRTELTRDGDQRLRGRMRPYVTDGPDDT